MTILKVSERLTEKVTTSILLTLPFDLRQKSRLRATLDNGQEIGLLLPRGQILRDGDCLRAENGLLIKVQAAAESVSTAFAKDPITLARACYHLGNRHIALQIGDTWLRYQHDHVLDEMVAGLGLQVNHETAPFEPEPGAYHSHGHSHSHNHDHKHEHSHPNVKTP
jgi:urease accessory protein